MTQARTLFEKIWQDHVVHQQQDGTCLIYIDRHLVHEVTSPQAFEGLRMAGRKIRRPDLTLAVADHNVPTSDRSEGIADEDSRIQVDTLTENCADFGITYFGMDDNAPDRQQVVQEILPYIDREMKKGVPLKSITRHMLGLFQGRPGAKAWRRHISENAHLKGATPDILTEAAAKVR